MHLNVQDPLTGKQVEKENASIALLLQLGSILPAPELTSLNLPGYRSIFMPESLNS
jgi:hypothetical protein